MLTAGTERSLSSRPAVLARPGAAASAQARPPCGGPARTRAAVAPMEAGAPPSGMLTAGTERSL
eukprot:12337383-Alexandrium_andersonii.AAC.1